MQHRSGSGLALFITARQVNVAQRNVEIVIGRLVTDEAFRSAFGQDAMTALAGFIKAGHELTPTEITALMATSPDAWTTVAEQIDPRLQKASLRWVHISPGRD